LFDPAEKILKTYNSSGTGVFVKNLSIIPCDNYNEIIKLLAEGKKLRIVAATKMNATSSRSHAIFTLYYKETTMNEGKKIIKNSKINIVDLAGSERQASTGATGERLKEGSNINKSLSYLGLVIQALAKNSAGGGEFVPY